MVCSIAHVLLALKTHQQQLFLNSENAWPGVFPIYSRLAVHPLLSASQNLLERARNLTRPGALGLSQTQYFTKCNFHGTFWNMLEPLRNLQRMEAKQNIGFSEHTGTCWNLLEPVWSWAPGLGQTQLSQIAIPMEPIGTCLNLCGTYSLRGPNSTPASRNLLEPARNIYGFGHLVSAEHNFPENEIPMKPFGTCLNFCRTYSLRGPNSTSACRNLLEPARNLFGFEHLALAKRKFRKNPLRSEPTGTL